MICTYCGKDIKDLDNLKTLEYEEDKVLVCSDKCANIKKLVRGIGLSF